MAHVVACVGPWRKETLLPRGRQWASAFTPSSLLVPAPTCGHSRAGDETFAAAKINLAALIAGKSAQLLPHARGRRSGLSDRGAHIDDYASVDNLHKSY